jgi:hypothetical protein
MMPAIPWQMEDFENKACMTLRIRA